MTPTLTPEQSKLLHAFADGQTLEFRRLDSDIWIEAKFCGLSFWLSSSDHEVRIKPKPEILRFRVGIARRGGGTTYTFVATDEQDAARAVRHLQEPPSYIFLGWAGPWQEVDVSTLTKDEE